ncbi:hypothetical protein JCGZ_01233 [Jatropha curcas]|uniref:RING-type domain-containing protein n=1 Tax=Jatropha curcas TaxID=180498 RepID=A0A067LC17_JATCU|nr:RING-H2 finger protein ATL66 [Jatropha curcas]KDP44733.1 hypothetical protein JCGZ_01233 [Jatropha curcas]
MSSNDSQQFHWHFTELNDNDFEIHGRTLFFIIILFAIVVLLTLLFLYARWVCRYQYHHFPTRHSLHAPNPPLSRPQGLDPTIIKALPITLHQSSSSSSSCDLNSSNTGCEVETECCICLGLFDDGDKVKVLPNCKHFFHSECVDRWLTAQSSCPLCRASLRNDSSSLVSVLIE